MNRLGAVLALFGFGSALLHFTDIQFQLLMWAEKWQPALGLILGGVGAVLLLIGTLRGSSDTPAAPQGGYGPPVPPGSPPQQGYGPPPQGYGPGQPPIPQQGPQYGPRPPQGPPQQRGPGPQYGPPGH